VRRKKAFTLVELLVVIAIIALLISILLPSLSRARELSKRLVCASNVKGIGTSAKIYANDNNEKWMIPGFDQNTVSDAGNAVQYWKNVGNSNTPTKRSHQSTRDTALDPNGSTDISVTRCFWMLVRSGDVTVQQFTCPSAGDAPDETENVDFYYDFYAYDNISYGYQVPFGPRDTQAREGMDNRMVIAGDKGPFYNVTTEPKWDEYGEDPPLSVSDSPREWRAFNSANHGGSGNGEGQNLLYADGHASFAKLPIVGIDHDNVYTVIGDQVWGDFTILIWGNIPYLGPENPNPYPGQWAFSDDPTGYSSTDSLLYP
jgi:prepilin-type N-terminal cleavage/methylation domain-containing protein/prepilin-type processing-associated H-X9-DG protein